ncbi:MAG: co-chaperone YbbN [Vibrio sp.]
MQPDYIFELNEQNFRATLEASQQTQVLVHLWAPSIAESASLVEPLKQLAQQYQGAFQLALLNCEQEQAIASQFGVQSLPTLVLLSQGQAIDGLAGPQSIDAISQMLSKHLPSQDELALKQIQTDIEQGEFDAALLALQNLNAETLAHPEVQLLQAKCLIETNQFDAAKSILEQTPMQYKDASYDSLINQIELHEQAANSPEIQNLEQQLNANPDDLQVRCDLALQYHQVNRDEEALGLLMAVLQKDINALDGKIKAECLSILSALGQNHPVAKQFRRKLYALLY